MDPEHRLRREWSYFDASNARLASVVENAPPDDVRAASTRSRLARRFGTIVSRDESIYRLPPEVVERAGDDLSGELRELLLVLKELNDQFVGLEVRDAHVLLNADPLLVCLRRDLLNCVGYYAAVRVASADIRSAHCPVEAYQRLYADLWPFLDGLVQDLETLHSLVLLEPVEFYSWFLAKETWLPFVRSLRQEDHGITVETRFTDAARKAYCGRLVQLHGGLLTPQ